MQNIQSDHLNLRSELSVHDYLMTKRGAARTIAHQLLNSGTSVGANLEKAGAAQSKADFMSKCSIASKEARETRYWLRLVTACRSVKKERVADLVQEAGEIVAILTSIVKKAGSSANRSTLNIQH